MKDREILANPKKMKNNKDREVVAGHWLKIRSEQSKQKHMVNHSVTLFLLVKLWFTTMCFVGFNSMPNLTVILFNLLYPIFIMGFDCKGCVIERECEDSSNWRLKSFCGYLAAKHPAKWLMWFAHAAMRRVRTRWRQLCLTSILRVRPSCETPARHSVLPNCQFWNTLFVPILFIFTLPTNVEGCFWEKTLAKHLES